jgi:mannose-6-phosphate isomerase-like protein (cupin superfamily)
MRSMFLGVAVVAMTASMTAQTPPMSKNPVDVTTNAAILARGNTMVAQARADPDGNAASVTLENYPGHLTMLAVRVRDGGAEVHTNVNDFLIVEEGDGTEVTGGKVIGGKEISPGEIRGLRVEGGTPHVLHKGDVIHIKAGVPHQALVPAGKPFIYYVIKVTQPKP